MQSWAKMLNLKINIISILILFSTFAFGDLIRPDNGAELNYIHVLFEWDQEPDAIGYNLQVSTQQFFNSLLLDMDEITTVYIDTENFNWNNNYHWRVRPIFDCDIALI